MSFEEICRSYLGSLAEELATADRTGQATDELSFRTPLDNFFNDVCQYFDADIDKIHEPANIKSAGRPDWRFSNSEHQGVYGYVEAKGVDLGNTVDVESNREQIEKYLSLGQDVILTDGLDFAFWDSDEQELETVALVDKPVDVDSLQDESLNPGLETRLSQFFEQAYAHGRSEDEIIRQAAKHANQISSGVRNLVRFEPDQAKDEEERHTIETLNSLRSILEEHHDPTIQDRETFSGFIAQVLIFGLLYPHRIGSSEDMSPPEMYEYLHTFWEDSEEARLRPFKALVDLLDEELEEGELGRIGTWYDDFRHYLSYVSLDQEQRRNTNYHKLYEEFLNQFDSEQRFEFGAFYTPPEIVEFTVGLVDAITSHCLEDVSLYDDDNKLVDPCSGTGSFLEALAVESPNEKDPEIAGFEILPAPYALSHYRMAMIDGVDGFPANVSVVLTNTLLDQLTTEPEGDPENMVETEQREAWRISKPPLLLIIGNPPSRNSRLKDRNSGPHFEVIEEKLDDFRPPEDQRTGRSNIQKQVRNTFMKFLRWGGEKIEESPRGILAFIVPSSFSTGESYKYARKWLVDRFDSIWLLDLDRDGRTGEKNHSLFKTRQGRTLVVALNEAEEEGGENDEDEYVPADVHHASITGKSEDEKNRFLSEDRSQQAYFDLFCDLNPQDPHYDFRRGKSFPEDLWIQYWPLKPGSSGNSVFERHCSGVKCAPTHFVIHADGAMLRRRTQELADPDKTFEELTQDWFDGMPSPPKEKKRTEDVVEALENTLSNWDESTTRYSYRPLVSCQAVITDELMSALGNTSGDGTRDRPELRSAFKSDDTIGLGVAPSPYRLGDGLHRFASFCWDLPDNDLAYRGSARVLCSQYPEEKSGDEWDSTPKSNVRLDLLERLESEYDQEVTEEDVVYYTYAILSSNAYLSKFEGALFRNGVNPRIPFPAEVDLFESGLELGKSLAKLEKPESGRGIGEYQDYLDSFTGPFKLDNPVYYSWMKDEGEGSSKIIFKNRESKDEEFSIEDIPSNVVSQEISGNKPIYESMKLYSYPYSRRDFRKSDYKDILTTINSIEKQIDLLKENNDDIKRIVSGSIEILESK
jgi:hypothetical protein